MALDASGKPVGHFLVRSVCYSSNAVGLAFIVVDPQVPGQRLWPGNDLAGLIHGFWGDGNGAGVLNCI